MLFLDRMQNQTLLITVPTGEELLVEVIGTTDDGAIRLGFKGPKFFDIAKMNKEERAHFNLKKREHHKNDFNNSTSQFPSDHIGNGYNDDHG